MNILFFLTPKSKIKSIVSNMSIRQVLEIFEHYRYTVLPIIDENGCFIKTINEGDLLYYVKNNLKFNVNEYNNINVLEVPTYRSYTAINVLEPMDALINMAMDQNFVPVVDDKGVFIGIITRKSILSYLRSRAQDALGHINIKE